MKTIIISIKALLFFTLLTGLIYPLFILGVGNIFFPGKSSGSFIEVNGNKIGSELISQSFDSSIYFQPRPSAISYLPMPSSGSNLGPTSQKLKDLSDSLRQAYIKRNFLPENTIVPTDAIFASGSGIDPDISPENAFLQMDRVAKIRNFDEDKKNKLMKIIDNLIENRQFGFLGEPRVNVLKLNNELDKL